MGKMQETVLREGLTYLSQGPGAARPSPKIPPAAQQNGIPVTTPKTRDVSGGTLSGSAMGAAEAKPPTSRAPHPKVAGGVYAGMLAVVLVWLAGLAGIVMPPEVAAAVAGLVSGAAAYFTPSR